MMEQHQVTSWSVGYEMAPSLLPNLKYCIKGEDLRQANPNNARLMFGVFRPYALTYFTACGMTGCVPSVSWEGAIPES